MLIGLAPMAGFTDRAFRTVCTEQGADFTVTEMVSAKGLFYKNERTGSLLAIEGTRPCGVQIFGSEAEPLEYAARYISETAKPDFIDLNMGCPTPKIVSSGDGAALLKDSEKALEAALAVIAGAGKTPVTVKLRIGWDGLSDKTLLLSERLGMAGVKALFIHGRTARQMYRPPVDFNAVRQIGAASGLPFFANGDITDLASAEKAVAETGASGLLIGRAALGNPFIFKMLKCGIEGKAVAVPGREEIRNAALRQLEIAVADKGDRRAAVEARSQLAFYLKGQPEAAERRHRLALSVTAKKTAEILSEL